MSNKLFYAILGIVMVAIIGGLSLASGGDSSPNSDSGTQKEQLLSVEVKDLFISGSADSKTVLYEYSDFQCPACAAYYPLVSSAEEEFGQDLAIIFRHFPLTSIHPNAMTAHKIAQAAALQGKFTPIYKLLYEQNEAWASSDDPSNDIINLISQSGLEIDLDRLRVDAESAEVQSAIDADMDSGDELGINGTPTFYLGDQKITFKDYSGLSSKIKDAMGSTNE